MQVLHTTIRRNDAVIALQLFIGEALAIQGLWRKYLLAVQTYVVHHDGVKTGDDDRDRRLLARSIHHLIALFSHSMQSKPT